MPAASPPGPSCQGLPGQEGEASGLQACPPVVPSDLRGAPPPLRAHFPSVKQGVRLCRKATWSGAVRHKRASFVRSDSRQGHGRARGGCPTWTGDSQKQGSMSTVQASTSLPLRFPRGCTRGRVAGDTGSEERPLQRPR